MNGTCGWWDCGQPGRGRLRTGWVIITGECGVRRRYCPECAALRSPEVEPEPEYVPAPPPEPTPPPPSLRVPVVHATRPGEDDRCADPKCGQQRGRGHPPRGWIRLWAEHEQVALWFCSAPCALAALVPVALVQWPQMAEEWTRTLTVADALALLTEASGHPMTVMTMTPERVRRGYALAQARLDPDSPGFLAHRARLAASRSRLLAHLNAPDEVDDGDEPEAPPMSLLEALAAS